MEKVKKLVWEARRLTALMLFGGAVMIFTMIHMVIKSPTDADVIIPAMIIFSGMYILWMSFHKGIDTRLQQIKKELQAEAKKAENGGA